MQRLLSRRLVASRVQTKTLQTSSRRIPQPSPVYNFPRISVLSSAERCSLTSPLTLDVTQDRKRRYFSDLAESGINKPKTTTIMTMTMNSTVSTSLVEDIKVEALSDDDKELLRINDTFRYQLNKWYRDNHDISLKDAFATQLLGTSDDVSTRPKLWTATFECPVTKDQFHAGKLPGAESVSQQAENRWYYSKKKYALQAAAMKALDQYCALQDDDTTVNSSTSPTAATARSILQVWYMKQHKLSLTDGMFDVQKKNLVGKAHGGTWWTTIFTCPVSGQVYDAMKLPNIDPLYEDAEGYWYRKKNDAIHAAAAHALEAMKDRVNDQADAAIPVAKETNETETANLTRAPLESWYKTNHSTSISEDEYVVSSTTFDGKNGDWWTASFICPISGDRYDSGTLRSVVNSDSIAYSDSNGLQWYPSKEVSIVAAALRALDTMRFEEKGNADFQYCEEGMLGDDAVKDNTDSMNPQIVSAIPGVELTSETIVFDEGEEQYVIEIVPQRIGAFGEQESLTKTTLDLIAETWIESSTMSRAIDPLKPQLCNPLDDRKQAIERARDWIAQQQHSEKEKTGERTEFDDQGRMSSRNVANLILASMASAHQQLPFDYKTCGVEKTAKAMIDYLWSSASSKPDASTYASYIKCLEGDDPKHIADWARRIFYTMSDESELEGNLLPRPNIEMYNSVLQRLAEAGIKTPIDEIDSRFQPNRETFLSCLSSVAHSRRSLATTDGFDADYALRCIEHMRQLSETSNDPSLRLDIDVFNAPLPWSGGLLSESSRPYSRCLSWDSHNEIFRSGFASLDEGNSAWKDATAIDSWIQSINEPRNDQAISPDIETFESAIQAWVRTGTREGLKKAEALLESLIDAQVGDTQLRVQTFHPIIAAWVYSGAHESPSKVDRWTHKLRELIPGSKLDCRIRNAPILSRVASQGRALQILRAGNPKSSDSKIIKPSHISELACECTGHLEDMVNDHKTGREFLLEGGVFLLVVEAWRKAGVAHAHHGNVDGADAAMCAMKQLVQSFDGFVESCCDSVDDQHSKELIQVREYAPRVYTATLAAMREIELVQRESAPDPEIRSHLARHLDWIESMIRRSEEFRILAADAEREVDASVSMQPKDASSEQMVYDDLFHYPLDTLLHDTDIKTWLNFHSSVIQALEDSCPYMQRDSDIVRISLLLVNMQTAENESLTGSDARLCEDIAQLLKKLDNKSVESDSLIALVVRDLGAMALKMKRTAKLTKTSSPREQSEDSESGTTETVSGNRFRRRRTRGRDTRKSTRPRKATQSISRRQKQYVDQ